MSETQDPELSGPFGSYEILKLIGKGGMGSVYLARQPTLDRNIVIKVVRSELAADEGVARFQLEAMTAAKVVSDNIVQVYETGVERGLPYIAMEYVEGFSASEVVKMRGKLPWQEAVKIVVAAARGLQAAHASGVLHRDVKPANILVANDGRIKVADFGLAKHPQREAAGDVGFTPGVISGSPLYMAPEQIDGSAPLDHRADIYSLGATLFELVAGKPPFHADSPMTVMTLALTAPLPSLRELVPTIPVALEMACTKMLSRELDRRMPSMTAVIEALEAIPRGKERKATGEWKGAIISAPPPGSSAEETTYRFRIALGVALVFVILVGVLTLNALVRKVWSPTPTPGPAPAAPDPVPPPPPASGPPVPETPAPATRSVQLEYATKLLENTATHLAANEPNDAERTAREGLERVPGDERALRGRLLVGHATALMFLGRHKAAEVELRDAVTADAEHDYEAHFVSFCNAVLAKDDSAAEQFFRKLEEASIWGVAADEIKTAATSKKQPTHQLKVPSPIPHLAYLRTLDTVAPKPR